jgi:hypothetical protein
MALALLVGDRRRAAAEGPHIAVGGSAMSKEDDQHDEFLRAFMNGRDSEHERETVRDHYQGRWGWSRAERESAKRLAATSGGPAEVAAAASDDSKVA